LAEGGVVAGALPFRHPLAEGGVVAFDFAFAVVLKCHPERSAAESKDPYFVGTPVVPTNGGTSIVVRRKVLTRRSRSEHEDANSRRNVHSFYAGNIGVGVFAVRVDVLPLP